MNCRNLSRLVRYAFCLSALLGAANVLGAAEWKSLFNGKDLSGWKVIGGAPTAWKVEDGLLYCAGGGSNWLATVDEYANFELELEFRQPEGGNSGVFLRAPEVPDVSAEGMEIQILDDPSPRYATIQPWQHCGSLYGVVPAKPGALKKAGEWQKYHIVCNGRKVQVTLNGEVVVDANLDEHKDKEADHPGIKRTTGHIGLQNHDTRMDFRNIRVRTLD